VTWGEKWGSTTEALPRGLTEDGVSLIKWIYRLYILFPKEVKFQILRSGLLASCLSRKLLIEDNINNANRRKWLS
jgi:hypothetical protein